MSHRSPTARVVGDWRLVHFTARKHLRARDANARGGRPPLQLVRSVSGEHRHELSIPDLEWGSAAVEPADDGCLILRVPVAPGGAPVRYQFSPMAGGATPWQERPFLELTVPDRATAERVVEVMRTYLAAAEAGWTTMPPDDAPADRGGRPRSPL